MHDVFEHLLNDDFRIICLAFKEPEVIFLQDLYNLNMVIR